MRFSFSCECEAYIEKWSDRQKEIVCPQCDQKWILVPIAGHMAEVIKVKEDKKTAEAITRKVRSTEELESVIDSLTAKGYKIVSRNGSVCRLFRKDSLTSIITANLWLFLKTCWTKSLDDFMRAFEDKGKTILVRIKTKRRITPRRRAFCAKLLCQ